MKRNLRLLTLVLCLLGIKNYAAGQATCTYDQATYAYSLGFHTVVGYNAGDGKWYAWGEFSSSAGQCTSTPKELTNANFPKLPAGATIYKASLGDFGDATGRPQLIALTSQGLYAFGGGNFQTVTYNLNMNGSRIEATNGDPANYFLPTGVTPQSVTSLFVTQGLIVLQAGGKVYVQSEQDYSAGYIYGDMSTSRDRAWHTVKTGAGVDLANVAYVRGASLATASTTYGGNVKMRLIAATTDNKLYSWGEATSNSYATLMTPPQTTGNVKQVGMNYTSGGYTYYVLYDTGELWAMGANDLNQRGIVGGTPTTSNGWTRVQTASGIDATNIKMFATSEHGGDNIASLMFVDNDGKLYTAGSNDFGMSGQGIASSKSVLVGSPTGYASGVSAIAAGTHITLVQKAGEPFCEAGHGIQGSLANGTCDEFSQTTYMCSNASFTTCPVPPVAGIISGTVFIDNIPNNLIDGVASNLGGAYIAIIDPTTKKVVSYSPVASNGTYSTTAPSGSNYEAVITTTLPVIGSIAAASYPLGYVTAGEGIGTTRDGANNGSVSITSLATGTTTVNFAATYGTKADANTGIINQLITASVATNDVVPAGATYPTGAQTQVSGPAGGTGTLTMNTDGKGGYTFIADKAGTYTYNVPVCVSGVCVNTPLVITIADPTAPIGTNPIATMPDFATVTQNGTTPVSIDIPVLANDKSMSDNTGLSVTGVTQPANGTVSINPDGTVKYTPKTTTFAGTDVFYYTACELPPGSTTNCKTDTVRVFVNPPGATATIVASDDEVLIKTGTPSVSGNVADNDFSSNGTKIVTEQTTTISGKGELVLKSDGSYTFTPVSGFTGTASFPYTICNGAGACSNATLNIISSAIIPLPVTFGPISASIINGQLVINWSTLMEKNFDHFLVEVSKDGVNWKLLEKVSSKSLDGNSDREIKYSIIKNLSEITVMGVSFNGFGLLLAVLLGIGTAVSMRRRNRLVTSALTLLFAVSVAGTMASCKKPDIGADAKTEKVFVRITSVDKDGKTQTTRVIQAVQE